MFYSFWKRATRSFPAIGTEAVKWFLLIGVAMFAGALGVYIYGVLAPPTHNIGEIFAFAAAGFLAFIITAFLVWLSFLKRK
jgi:1,4-dihydroxy-2-naphthoate octaprenyltransferase